MPRPTFASPYLLGLPTNLPSSKTGVAETFPRELATADILLTGNWNAAACYLPAGLIINAITLFTGATAGGTLTHQWFGVWDKSLALVIGTTDDVATAWAANTAKRLAATAATRTTYSGLYYVGCGVSVSAGSLPSIASLGSGTAAGSTGSGAVRALTPLRNVLDSTTVLTAIAATLTNNAASNGMGAIPYAVID